MATIIIITRVLVVLLGLVGITANLLIAQDIRNNLRAAKFLKANGTLAKTAQIDVRGARASAGAHAMFLLLGIVALGTVIPMPLNTKVFGLVFNRQILTLVFTSLWDSIQAVVVLAQVFNQIERVQYRKKAS